MKNMPTFLVIGAARSGTTALYTYLRQHPEIFMTANKEPNFFAFENEVLECAGPGADYINNSTTNLHDYQQMFEGISGQIAAGEASPLYLFSRDAPRRIAQHLPDVKLVAILRNPVEQAYSHYLYSRRQMLEPLEDFVAALEAEEERKALHWQPLFQYSKFPEYGRQLQRYFSCFSEHQIRIHTYEDFVEQPLSVLSDIFSFIGADQKFEPNLDYRPNAGGIPKNRLLQNVVMKPHLATRLVGNLIPAEVKRYIRDAISDRNLEKPRIPVAAKEILLARLRDDILRLQELLNRDFSSWLL
jgi:hypothetical protein